MWARKYAFSVEVAALWNSISPIDSNSPNPVVLNQLGRAAFSPKLWNRLGVWPLGLSQLQLAPFPLNSTTFRSMYEKCLTALDRGTKCAISIWATEFSQSRHSDSHSFFFFWSLQSSCSFSSLLLFLPVQFWLFCEFIIPDKLTSVSGFFIHPSTRCPVSFFSNFWEHHFHWHVPGSSRILTQILYINIYLHIDHRTFSIPQNREAGSLFSSPCIFQYWTIALGRKMLSICAINSANNRELYSPLKGKTGWGDNKSSC